MSDNLNASSASRASSASPASASHVSSYSILSVPFYDTKQQQYIKILCVNAGPVVGPLAARVKTVRPPRLSGLHNTNNYNNNYNNNNNHNNNHNNKCIHAITTSSSACCTYMTPDDLPDLFAFLTTNDYRVDLGLTKLAAKHQSNGFGTNGTNSNSLVCLISYTQTH